MASSCNSIITTSFPIKLTVGRAGRQDLLGAVVCVCVCGTREICLVPPCRPPLLRLPNHLPTWPEPVHWANDTTVNLGRRALGHGSGQRGRERGEVGSSGGSENGAPVHCQCLCYIYPYPISRLWLVPTPHRQVCGLQPPRLLYLQDMHQLKCFIANHGPRYLGAWTRERVPITSLLVSPDSLLHVFSPPSYYFLPPFCLLLNSVSLFILIDTCPAETLDQSSLGLNVTASGCAREVQQKEEQSSGSGSGGGSASRSPAPSLAIELCCLTRRVNDRLWLLLLFLAGSAPPPELFLPRGWVTTRDQK